ncbi:MAG: DUF3089 domain-containing protein [Bacteroidota bacterium]
MKYLFLVCALALCFANCKSVYITPKGSFNKANAAKAPDYSQERYWAALPTKKDEADKTPKGLTDQQAGATVDVFFMHPTIYTGEKGDDQWNGPVDDPELNERVDESTIRFQASVFNGVGKVYAPRYRQAHINTYYIQDKAVAKKVFDLAYSDLKAAFEYYLENYNNGRPIIIASHSQGTTHSRRLVKEFFDGTPLQKQFVAGYLVGIPVKKDEFDNIPVCQNPSQTGCFTSWRTYETGFTPEGLTSPNIAVTNPITWTMDGNKAPKSENRGSVLRKLKKVHPELCSAEVVPEKGILWTDKPKFFGSFLLKTSNYHIADFNFYYVNVRENARERVAAFLAKNVSIQSRE